MYLYNVTLQRAGNIQVSRKQRKLFAFGNCLHLCLLFDLAVSVSLSLSSSKKREREREIWSWIYARVLLTLFSSVLLLTCTRLLIDFLLFQCAIYGSFSAPKLHEIVVSRKKVGKKNLKSFFFLLSSFFSLHSSDLLTFFFLC